MLTIDELLTDEERLEIDLFEWEHSSSPKFKLPLDSFNPVYIPYLTDNARTQIFYGGSSSGKSVFKAQQAVSDVLSGNGRNWLICRKVGKDNRHSTFVEVGKVIKAWGVESRFSINKTDLTITCDNDYQILFKGLDDLEKVKSITPQRGAITDIWVEEATQTEPDDIKQLYKRQRGGDSAIPKRLHMTFNPILRSNHIFTTYFSPIGWADDQTEYNDGRVSILKTWYIHNQFLTDGDIYDLENEGSEYHRQVYTFGNWGVLGDVIFTNWRVADLSDMHNQFTNRRNGLDFGFASDPAALTQSHYDRTRKTIYIYQELYERGLTNDILADDLRPLLGSDYVTCDSAEPKSIEELKRCGIRALGAAKGKDSVTHGIQWLQQQTIIIDKRCVNTINEFQQYQWKKDKDGNNIRMPIDRNNHIIDGLRYAYESDAQSTEAEAVDNPFYD